MITNEILKQLRQAIPCKWKPQTANERGCSLVAYVDARQVSDLLDEVCGPANWASDYKVVGDVVYGGVGINTQDGWVWKWDAGTESQMEADKGEASDAFKRAAVKWGVGRFLYDLEIVKTKSIRDNRQKWQPADDNGKRIWDCTEYVNRQIRGKSTRGPKVPKQEPATASPPRAGELADDAQKAQIQGYCEQLSMSSAALGKIMLDIGGIKWPTMTKMQAEAVLNHLEYLLDTRMPEEIAE